jgi:hypothetical protein
MGVNVRLICLIRGAPSRQMLGLDDVARLKIAEREAHEARHEDFSERRHTHAAMDFSGGDLASIPFFAAGYGFSTDFLHCEWSSVEVVWCPLPTLETQQCWSRPSSRRRLLTLYTNCFSATVMIKILTAMSPK